MSAANNVMLRHCCFAVDCYIHLFACPSLNTDGHLKKWCKAADTAASIAVSVRLSAHSSSSRRLWLVLQLALAPNAADEDARMLKGLATHVKRTLSSFQVEVEAKSSAASSREFTHVYPAVMPVL